jgi:DNA polymerase III epsilon subunit-like protein
LPLDKQPSIIEWYSCKVDLDTGEVLSELDVLIKPPKPISDEITRITGITNQMLADKPVFAFVAGDIAAAIESGERCCAHNASFDVEMVDIEFERLGRTLAWPRRTLCTVEATIHLKGFRLNLQGLHEHLFNERFAAAQLSSANGVRYDLDQVPRDV